MSNNKAAAVMTTPQIESKKIETKVIALPTDPREQKVQSIINIGRQIKRRSQLAEELAQVSNLHFDDTSKQPASISISDSGEGQFDNDNPQLVADLHTAAKESLQRQIAAINAQIDEFTALAA